MMLEPRAQIWKFSFLFCLPGAVDPWKGVFFETPF